MSCCKGKFKNGNPCTYKAKTDGYCKLHYKRVTECPICYEHTDNCAELVCHHKFHLDCISTWIKLGRKTCPVCRAIVTDTTIRKLGIVIDLKLEVLREAEKFFTGVVGDETSDIWVRYREVSAHIVTFLKSEQNLRRDIIDFMQNRIPTRRAEKEVIVLQKEVSEILKWIDEIIVKMAFLNIVTDETAQLFKKCIENAKKLQRWDRFA